MLLQENQAKIEKFLQKIDSMEDELDSAKRRVNRLQAQILQARDEGKNEKAVKLQPDLDAEKSKAEIIGLSIKKADKNLKLFIGKKLDAQLKKVDEIETKYNLNIKNLQARIGSHLKNALAIARALPGDAGGAEPHIKLCLQHVLPEVLAGRADMDTASLEKIGTQRQELSMLKNIRNNIYSKADAINKMYSRAIRRDFD